MKYGIITIGSQGDVEPFIALGQKLQQRGHQVQIAAFRKFEQYIRSEGFEYKPLAGDAAEVMRMLIGQNVSSFEYFRNLETLLNPIKEEFLQDIENACDGMDAILYTILGSVAWHVADKRNIPCFRVFFCPADPTGEFPAMTAPLLPLGSFYNRFTFACGDWLWSNATRKLLNDWRKRMGLEEVHLFDFPYRSLHGQPVPTLYAFSRTVVPKPMEWDENKSLTGYWIHKPKKDWQPEKPLLDFLAAGPKPVYIGFGSTVGGAHDKALDIVLESLERTKKRAILSAGWGNMQGRNLPDSIYQTGNVPHEWLFREVAAVVHHGGAGTTAAGLRAGVPTVIIPFGGDQPFWGNRVYKLGVGPQSILRKNLTVRNLSDAISEATGNPTMIEAAKKLGDRLQSEDGTENAIRIIEQFTCR